MFDVWTGLKVSVGYEKNPVSPVVTVDCIPHRLWATACALMPKGWSNVVQRKLSYFYNPWSDNRIINLRGFDTSYPPVKL